MKYRKSPERGQALIIIVLAIVALVGVTALAIDGGNALAERRRAQNAADAAALAGALQRVNNNNTSTWVKAVFDSAARNGYNNDGSTNVVQVFSPPISGVYSGDLEYIQVQITSYTRTYFAGVVGVPQITNKVEAISRTKTPTYQAILGGASIVSLAPVSDCDNKKSFWIRGEATLDISGSGIFVNSNNPTCALIEQGSGSIRINGGQILVVGGASIQKPKLLTPYPPLTNTPQIPYPPPFYMPKVGCGSKIAEISADGKSMTSGNWGDIFPPPGVEKLGSGVYCLGSDFIIEGGRQINGNGVVFKIESGRVQFAGDAQINLSAPKSGDLAGLLIYQPAENTRYLALNGGSKDSSIRGTILAPGAQIRLKGNDSNYGFHSQIIGYTIDVDGDSKIVIRYADEDNYDALTVPEIQFSK